MITLVLDDDPTGTQAMRDVTVILDWSDPEVWNAVKAGDRAVHVLTNSRAVRQRLQRGLTQPDTSIRFGARPGQSLSTEVPGGDFR